MESNLNLLASDIDSLGACSNGTLRSVDLLPRFVNYLSGAVETIDERVNLLTAPMAPYKVSFFSDCRSLISHAGDFHQKHSDEFGTDYPDELQGEAQDLIQDCIEYLNLLAPENYYFGSHPGDGADFGYWLWSE